MTTDARAATMDTKAAYPRQPHTVRLALLAAFVTAVLTGPVTLTLFLAAAVVRGGFPFRFDDAADMAERMAELVVYSAAFGLVGSLPAATINTVLLAYLARRRRDTASLAVVSGLALGFLVGVLITIIVGYDHLFAADRLDRLLGFALDLGLPLLVAGGLMGALHWSIAIRPRRHWRLFQERELAALRAME